MTFNIVLTLLRGDANPSLSDLMRWRSNRPGGMIARFDAIEQLAAALAAWEIQAHRTLANHPDPADLVRVARVQALIATTTVVVSEAAARRGEIDAGGSHRLTPALENAQLAWSRSARRWAELPTPASRTDPALVEAASQLRAAVGAAVGNQTGWATRTRSPAGSIYLQPP